METKTTATADTITCAWCGGPMLKADGVDAESHGICGPCADEWQAEDAYQLSRMLAAAALEGRPQGVQ